MGRAVVFFIVVFSVISALIFGYREITKNDIKVTGKLVFAGLLSLIFTAIVYVLELS